MKKSALHAVDVETIEHPRLDVAFSRLATVSRNLVNDYSRLVRIEAKEDLVNLFLAAALFGTGTAFLFFGWAFLLFSLLHLLQPALTWEGIGAIIAATHLVVGVVLAVIGIYKARQTFQNKNGE